MSDLFSPLTLRGITFYNRIGVAPMCMYCCAEDGRPTEWHLQHLVSRAMGTGMVMVEASSVVPEGRISPHDVGIWEDAQIPAHARIAAGMAAMGTVPAIQIAHAGRKASREVPWRGGPAVANGWQPVGPSAVPFDDFVTPQAMSEAEIAQVIAAFAAAAKRSVAAGYQLIEIHAAHGYLLHQFLSPLSNQRNDAWGGDLDGRARLALEVVKAVRAVLPDNLPLAIRVSHTDWVAGGWDTEETVELSRRFKTLGVDLVDVSSGGLHPGQKITLVPGYQVPGAVAVKEGAGIAVAAVGLITEPAHAQSIAAEGKADMILLAREFLRDPYWSLRAAAALGATDKLVVPPQYERGWNALGKVRRTVSIGEPLASL